MMKIACAAIAAVSFVVPANADTPLLVQQKKVEQYSAVLPANTEILVAMNESITTKGRHFAEGNTFEMSVLNDVMLGDYVVIPKGSRVIGWISWMTSKAVFGKSGKLEITIEYVEVGGKRIPLTGRYRQYGKGNTLGTVATVVTLGWPTGFLVTGHSGTIQNGTQFVARTREDLPVQFAEPVSLASAPLASAPLMVAAHATSTLPETPQTAQIPTANTSTAQQK